MPISSILPGFLRKSMALAVAGAIKTVGQGQRFEITVAETLILQRR
jgi:hypothetical protein